MCIFATVEHRPEDKWPILELFLVFLFSEHKIYFQNMIQFTHIFAQKFELNFRIKKKLFALIILNAVEIIRVQHFKDNS